MKKAGSKR